MKKNQLTPAHIILFVVSFLAVSLTATTYVRAYMSERRAEAQSANRAGGRGGAGRGAFNPQQMAARRLEEMSKQLQLTVEQRAKVEAIQTRSAPTIQAIFADATLSREQKREKMRPLRAESEAQIRQILLPEQQIKFDQMQAQRRSRFGGMRGGGGNGNPNSATGSGIVVNPPPPPSPSPAPQ